MPRLREWAEAHGAEIEELTQLQHAETGNGPWRLYVYRSDGYHTGGIWFRAGKPKYPDEEIPWREAELRTEQAVTQRREVGICDGGDNLVFHAVDGEILHGAHFWKEVHALLGE